MIHRWRSLYPVLLATLPPLFMAAQNTAEYAPRDLGWIVLALIVVFGVLLAAVAVVLRHRAPEAAPTIGLVAVLWFWAFVPVQSWFRNTVSWRLGASALLVPAGLLCTVGALWWILRRPARSAAITRTLSVMSLLLVVWSGGRVLRDVVRSAGPIEARSALARVLARPIHVDSSRVVAGAPRRDVYLLVMDTYPSGRVLREYFGFDNRPFEDSLRALGFVLPRQVRSNYTNTVTSLPSLLNMRHMTAIADEVGAESDDPALAYRLIEENAAARFLRSLGYSYVFHPSSWWRGTAESRLADVSFSVDRGLNLRRLAARSDLRQQLWRTSLLKLSGGPEVIFDSDHILRSFDGLANASYRRRPVFVFAHFLLPHRPYLYRPDCGKLAEPPSLSLPLGSAIDKRLFVSHLQCGNAQLLRVVRAILGRSPVPPIILIQGDHGPRTSVSESYTRQPSAKELRLSFDVFGAYYLPAGGDAGLGDSVTVVNLLRHVLVAYFGAELPMQPDDSYLSAPGRPYRLTRVDASLFDRGDGATP
jgi:hypothetical protein